MTTNPPILTYTLEEVLTRFEQKMDKQFSDINQKMDRQFVGRFDWWCCQAIRHISNS
ncbi:hypothetical protein [Pseudanabaena sp. PCC 6802]|uniref:hypothetical protein n=1 Tax=Pseudanabaena sp. PCC 6802 TaxID=118173 RepID=UPI000344F155|nr:hypothetical protein [Pseudanabaena sp. PCC 6802]